MSSDRNTLINSLAELAAGEPLREKTLLAPSRRVGIQWLDSVARSGRPVLNFRVNTIDGLAVEMASPLMAERGLKLAGRARVRVSAGRAFAGLAGSSAAGYLARLAPGPGLTDTLVRTICDLRMAGIDAGGLQPAAFEVEAKGAEIKALLEGYARELECQGLVDVPGAFRLALEGLSSDRRSDRLLAMPEDMADGLLGLESRLWRAFPDRVMLRVDRARERAPGCNADSALLSFVNSPLEAPPAAGSDGSVEIFRAVGEVNEVREVIRRCVEREIPFDDVEIIHTDTSTYVPLLYELSHLLAEDGRPLLPVTFYEGLPAAYSRPGRALAGWVSWIESGLAQSVLVEMLADGLLDVPGGTTLSFARLAAILRAVPVGAGRDRYPHAIESELRALYMRLNEGAPPPGADNGHGESTEARRALSERMSGLEAVSALVASLLKTVPCPGADGSTTLDLAGEFLSGLARGLNEFDNYCSEKLLRDISEMSRCLAAGDLPGFDPLSWLAGLPRETMLMGEGPRPGCLYVTGIDAGGHSARRNSFVVGLDDGRFPGSGGQDPLLLDGERARVSADLATGESRLSRRLDDFAGLMARLRGNVTFSYSCRDLVDDRELFPSPVALSAYRIIGRRDGDHEDLARWAGDPVSFAPADPGRALDEQEWWLSRGCRAGGSGLRGALEERFPNLARGMKAAAARSGDSFTEYDGWVPEAGADYDPAAPDGPVMSASKLELLAACPLEYFFKYILEIEPLEEYELDPNTWLDRARMGGLLHSVFRKFMSEITARRLRPDYGRDLPLMLGMLDQEISLWRRLRPPASEAIFKRAERELGLTARIFLREEQEHCRDRTPEYFEMAVGLEPEGEGCPLDHPDPVTVRLSETVSIRVRGRIDRIDRLHAGTGLEYEVWDYKTGGTYGYSAGDPFRQGRHVQGALYLELADARLAGEFPGARAVSFGYFFPGEKAHGERIGWTARELSAAGPLLLALCELASGGCFPFTDVPDGDLKFSDYLPAYGDTAKAAGQIKRKLSAPDNPALEPFRTLRGMGANGSGVTP